MKTWRTTDGVSLVELLVSLAILGIVLACVFEGLHGALKAYRWGVGRVEAQQSARVAMERMTAELREAGYDPKGAGIQPIVTADHALVTFQKDANANGIVDPTRERITFVLRAGETTLRRDAGGGAQPIIDGVRRFTLAYFDKAGVPVSDPARVASVRIHLEVGLVGPVAVIETDVSLRNHRAP
ncbi:MAG TPA: prepilin-type N-terminal cleavage/methylation domain-containing protein [Candidatus Methylomirabilis sp.]|nr:prepilin-type N-terminal cleavage/methylation domain-containing protein [Candidatus Methylomirabilis sp.]